MAAPITEGLMLMHYPSERANLVIKWSRYNFLSSFLLFPFGGRGYGMQIDHFSCSFFSFNFLFSWWAWVWSSDSTYYGQWMHKLFNWSLARSFCRCIKPIVSDDFVCCYGRFFLFPCQLSSPIY